MGWSRLKIALSNLLIEWLLEELRSDDSKSGWTSIHLSECNVRAISLVGTRIDQPPTGIAKTPEHGVFTIEIQTKLNR